MSPPFQEALAPCQERAGFLFAHDCPRSATQLCNRCAKPICTRHGHPAPSGEVLCTSCFKDEHSERDETESDLPQDEREEDNPYLYSSYYYRGHGYYERGDWGHDLLHDPNDFTEADGESLRARDPQRFEEDMGGS